ncbi:hypothetical protein BDV97DRAFT_161765 [Delphinella strobiligena]|nr:hypothetical protein BDV97DRAFT_161765 [Delphinella strobiligena]
MPLTLEILRVLAQARMSRRTASTIPTAVQNNIPTCAQQCVVSAIDKYFLSSSCTNTTDLGCLCSHYSTEGMTLGETSLICLNADCPPKYLNASASHSAYDVCAGQSKAVSATHSVLTALETAADATMTSLATSSASASTFSTSGASQTSMSMRTITVGMSITASSSVLSTPSSDEASTLRSTSLSPTTTTTTAYPNTTATPPVAIKQSSTLTSGQAVGVSIGALAGLGSLITLIFCCCCVRRRKQKKECKKENKKSRHSFDFVDKSPAPSSPFPQSSFRQHAPYPPYRYAVPGQRSAVEQKDDYNTDCNSNKTKAHGSTLVVEPEAAYRPVTVWPVPRRNFSGPYVSKASIKPVRPRRPDSDAMTMFEEDNKTPHLRSAAVLPALPSITHVPPNNRPSMAPRFVQEYTLSPEELHHPSLSLEIPTISDAVTHEHRVPASPTQMTPDSSSMTRASHMSIPPNSAISYLPAYYTSNDSRTPILPTRSPGYTQRFSYPHPMPKVAKTPHMSFASDTTTFESIDPDEITPPEEEDKRLSAVAESPLSSLRYPKVPRPSNQAIPRSPLQSRWTASTTFSPTSFSPAFEEKQQSHFCTRSPEKTQRTLITKRRGSDAAQDLEQRLHINHNVDDDGSLCARHLTGNGLHIAETGSPSKGRAASSSAYQESPELIIKSPLWEPELTPSKRGDDLFISVH